MRGGEMKKSMMLSIVTWSLALSAVISSLQGSIDFSVIAINCLIYSASFAIVCEFHKRYWQRIESINIMEELMRGLSRVLYYRSANLPTVNSLEKAAAASSNRKVSKTLNEAAKRIELGENFFDSISDSTNLSAGVSLILGKYAKSAESGIKEALHLHESKKKSDLSRSNALASRYATCNMFVSTVAPAFVIFSFIGSMLISQTASSTEFMSIALIAGIPVAFSVINSISVGRSVG